MQNKTPVDTTFILISRSPNHSLRKTSFTTEFKFPIVLDDIPFVYISLVTVVVRYKFFVSSEREYFSMVLSTRYMFILCMLPISCWRENSRMIDPFFQRVFEPTSASLDKGFGTEFFSPRLLVKRIND